MHDYNPSECPVCRCPAPHQSIPNYRNLEQYECRRCGQFVMAYEHARMLSIGIDLPSDDALERISPLLRERTIHKQQPYLLVIGGTSQNTVPNTTPISIEELLLSWPNTVPERLQRALLNLAKLSLK